MSEERVRYGEAPLTEERLRGLEARANHASDPDEGIMIEVRQRTILDLVAEVRRLRGLFSEEDAEYVDVLARAFYGDDRPVDLARRIREAIGHPPTDSESDDA